MLSGKILDEFEFDGDKAVIRYPRMADGEDLMKLMNSLIEEGAKIARQENIDFEEEVDWMADDLKEIEKDKSVHLILEVGGEAVGSASVTKKNKEAKSHVGSFGIVIKKGFREQGLGSKIMEVLLKEAKERLDLEILILDVFEDNERALNFYRKFGFNKAGKLNKALKVEGEYKNQIIMEKNLKN